MIENTTASKSLWIDTTQAERTLGTRSPGLVMTSHSGTGQSSSTLMHFRHLSDLQIVTLLNNWSEEDSHSPGASSGQHKASNNAYKRGSKSRPYQTTDPMPPPLSGGTKGLSSGSLTPRAGSAVEKPGQGSFTSDFGALAESITAASTLKVKLDSHEETAVQNDIENRRSQHFSTAYQSLLDNTAQRHEANQRARAQISKQISSCSIYQNTITSKLDSQISQGRTLPVEPGGRNGIDSVISELAEMRKERRATQAALQEIKRDGLTYADLDRYMRKVVHADDLDQFVHHKEFRKIDEKYASRDGLRDLEKKLFDLEATGKQNADRFDQQTIEMEKCLGKYDESGKESASFAHSLKSQETDLLSLRQSLAELAHAVHGGHRMGDTTFKKDEFGLVGTLNSISVNLDQIKDTTERLASRIQRLAEVETSQPKSKDVLKLRSEFDDHTEAQKAEHAFYADGINQLEIEFRQAQQDIADLKITKSSSSPSTTIAQTPSTALYDMAERSQTDIKAMHTQVLFLKQQFENLTTEQLAQSIINHMKQIYQDHPAHVHDKLRIIDDRLNRTDAYLRDRLEPSLTYLGAAQNTRASIDVVNQLQMKMQIAEGNTKQAYEHSINTRKELSRYLDTERASTQNHISPPLTTVASVPPSKERSVISRPDEITSPVKTHYNGGSIPTKRRRLSYSKLTESEEEEANEIRHLMA